jgi:hypothetical protein
MSELKLVALSCGQLRQKINNSKNMVAGKKLPGGGERDQSDHRDERDLRKNLPSAFRAFEI